MYKHKIETSSIIFIYYNTLSRIDSAQTNTGPINSTISRTTIQKQVTSTDSSKFHESESEEDEIRRHNPNNKSSISLNDPFIAIPKVKLTSS